MYEQYICYYYLIGIISSSCLHSTNSSTTTNSFASTPRNRKKPKVTTEKYKICRFIADWRKRITEAAIGPLRDIIRSRFLSLRKKSCRVMHAINTCWIVFSCRRRNLDNWTYTLASYFDITNISQYINHAYLARLLSQTRILVCLHSCPQFLYLFKVFHLFPLILFLFLIFHLFPVIRLPVAPV